MAQVHNFSSVLLTLTHSAGVQTYGADERERCVLRVFDAVETSFETRQHYCHKDPFVRRLISYTFKNELFRQKRTDGN